MAKRGQSSVEFLLIVAFSLVMLIPATLIFLNYSADSRVAVVNSQVYQTANELALTAGLMYGVGPGSWQTIELLVPEDVNSAMIYEGSPYSEIVINYGDPGSTVVMYTAVPLRNSTATDVGNCSLGCNLPVTVGLNRIRVENRFYVASTPKIHFTVLS